MKIKIDLKLFLFALIFVCTHQIKIYAIMMLFALIHECGHLLAGLILGLKPESIKISIYGFSINFKTDYSDYNTKIKNASIISLKKILIAFAGPLTNLIIIVIIYIYYLISHNTYILNISLDLIIYSNILIFIFNLIPIYPLDGGRILKEFIRINCGVINSYIWSRKISKITIIIITILSSFFILIYKNISILIVLAYLWLQYLL